MAGVELVRDWGGQRAKYSAEMLIRYYDVTLKKVS
jgi:hypothetical protein